MKKRGFWVSAYYDPDFSTVCFIGDNISSVMLAHAGIGVAAILWMDFNPNCQKELFREQSVWSQPLAAPIKSRLKRW